MDHFYHPSMVASIHCNYHSYLDGLSHMDGLKIEPRGYLSILVSNPVLTISHYKAYWWSISQYVYHLKMTIIGFTTLIHLGWYLNPRTRWWTIYRGTKKPSGTVGSSPTFPGLRGGSATYRNGSEPWRFARGFKPSFGFSISQWIGLGENLQENPIFNGKIYGFR